MLAGEEPTYVHIATEGPLGLSARAWCQRMGKPFSTSYHTRFPEYVSARWPIPEGLAYAYVRHFHNAGNVCMVATESLQQELSEKGFQNLRRWSRGIDARLFRPMAKASRPFDLPRPIFMTVGRIAVEKNLPAFLDLDLPGSKVVVGDGPAREELEARYPDVHFTGFKTGQELAETYAQADVFVFPSKTDTFGNTILEAMASGVPVAAHPVTGPGDILKGQEAAAHWMMTCARPASGRCTARQRRHDHWRKATAGALRRSSSGTTYCWRTSRETRDLPPELKLHPWRPSSPQGEKKRTDALTASSCGLRTDWPRRDNRPGSVRPACRNPCAGC